MYTQNRNILLLYFLSAFLFLRPFASTYLLSPGGPLGGFNLRDVFGLTMAYSMLLAFLLNLSRTRLNTINISIFLFICYSALSILWGSDLRHLTRIILPTFVFLALQPVANDQSKINALFIVLMVGFWLPVITSTVLVLSGLSVSHHIYWTGLDRYGGVYFATHQLAHEMFVFISLSLFYIVSQKDWKKNRTFTFIICFFIILAIFNIYKSYVRTVYVGLVSLIGFYLIGQKRYKLLAAGFLFIVVAFVTSSEIQTVFWDIIEPFDQSHVGPYAEGDLAGIGSGRFGIWRDALTDFINLPAERILLGTGIGNETLGGAIDIGLSHNDFISLLRSLGIIGLLLYLLIILNFFVDIVRCNLDRTLKYTYLGYVLAISAMNFASNAYVTRFEMSQYFFFTMWSFYALADIANKQGKI